jgi:DNA-binding transcriptional LysR family regulator
MELRHLRYFLAVAEEGSFTRAAGRLGISQPPLSQQIRDLEQEVGVPLFDRVAHGAALTEAGRVFLIEARSTIERAERAKAFARRAGEGATGLLRLGITATATFNPVPSATIRQFRQRFPDVAITIDEGRSIRLIERLLTNELDAVFVRPSLACPSTVNLSIAGREAMVLALPNDHSMAEGPPVALGDLTQESFIVLGKSICASFHDAVMQAGRAAGFDPIIGHQASRLTSILDMVASGLGVALVPRSLAHVAISGVRFREVADEMPSIPLALAVRGGNVPVVIANFLEALPAAK